MILSDWILLITAAIVAYYAFETYKIRRETSKQNTLLAEQLALMQQSLQFEKHRQTSFIRPVFRFEGGQHSNQSASIHFVNKGGPARKLSAHPMGNFRVTVSPATIIDSNEKGVLQISSSDLTNPDKSVFEIGYQDKFGDSRRDRFYFSYQSGHISPDDSGG